MFPKINRVLTPDEIDRLCDIIPSGPLDEDSVDGPLIEAGWLLRTEDADAMVEASGFAHFWLYSTSGGVKDFWSGTNARGERFENQSIESHRGVPISILADEAVFLVPESNRIEVVREPGSSARDLQELVRGRIDFFIECGCDTWGDYVEPEVKRPARAQHR